MNEFLARLWEILLGSAKFILGIAFLAALAITAVIMANRDDDSAKDSQPEIAQVFEPSIGAPLPPDVAGESSSEETVSAPGTSGTVAGESETSEQPIFIAPPTGIDPDKPIKYNNSDLGFSAVLPPRTTITEKDTIVNFFSPQGQLLASVYAVSANETLANLETQLSLSPDTKQLQTTTWQNLPALSYQQKHFAGIAAIASNQVLYLLAQPELLSNFSL